MIGHSQGLRYRSLAAVIAQIRDIRDQMRVIKIKRNLEKEKYELQKLKQQKSGEGVMQVYS